MRLLFLLMENHLLSLADPSISTSFHPGDPIPSIDRRHSGKASQSHGLAVLSFSFEGTSMA